MVAVCVLIASACSPVKGYPGPELPTELTAIVKYTTTSSNTSVARATLNNLSFRSSGISVLGGQHHYELGVEIEGEPFDCDPYASFDEAGYDKCQRKESACDCLSYLTVNERCQKEVQELACQGELETAIGRSYSVSVEGTAGFLTSTANELGTRRRLSSSACVNVGRHFEEIDRYLGTGSSYGYKLGLWENPCY